MMTDYETADDEQLKDDEQLEDERLAADLRDPGWQVIMIMEDEEGPAFAFTLGLFHSFGHPEMLIAGLDLGLMHQLLNLLGDAVKGGRSFETGSEAEDVLDRYRCAFVRIEKRHYPEYLGSALRFYRDDAFPAVQCVWPDREGRYPWQPGYPDGLRQRQPVLGSWPG